MDSKLMGINHMKLVFIRKTNLKLDLLNFNIFGSSEYEKMDIFEKSWILFCSKNFLRLLTYNKKCKNHMYPNLLILWEFYVLKNFTIHFTLSLIFRVWPYHSHIWIYEFITSWTSMFNKTVSKDKEVLLPSLGMIKHIAW